MSKNDIVAGIMILLLVGLYLYVVFSFGEALDKEFQFQDKVVQQYK